MPQRLEKVITDMEIDESVDLQERAWRIQPVAWTIIGLFVLLGILGLFGTGPISHQQRRTGPVVVQFEQFHREGSVMQLVIKDMGDSLITRVRFPARYLGSFRIQSIVPEPSSSEHEAGYLSYHFRGISAQKKISFFLEPHHAGKVQGALDINGNIIPITHIIFP